MAIAARMPMIKITTRSSIRVKPFSSWARSRSFRNIGVLLLDGGAIHLYDQAPPLTSDIGCPRRSHACVRAANALIGRRPSPLEGGGPIGKEKGGPRRPP